LGEILNRDRELEAFLQRLVGYCLTGQTTEHVLIVLWGGGSNGKTTLIELLLRMCGDYAAALSPDVILISRHGDDNLRSANRAQLRGLHVAVMQETPKRRQFDEATVKALTGSDTITACLKYQNPMSFAPTHKLILSTNYKPGIGDSDYGIWRRICLV